MIDSLLLFVGESKKSISKLNKEISRLCDSGDFLVAVKILEGLEVSNVQPDSSTYHCMIRSLTKRGEEKLARHCLTLMLEKGLLPCTESVNLLMKQYFIQSPRALEKASSLFRRMKELQVPLDAYTYNSLLHVYALNGQVTLMEQLFEDMNRQERLVDWNTLSIMLKGYCKAGDVQKLVVFLSEAAKNPKLEGQLNIGVYNCYVDSLLQLGQMNTAEKILEHIFAHEAIYQPTIYTYNTLLKLQRERQDDIRAMQILDDMKEKGVVPDIYSFCIVADCLCRKGKMKEAMLLRQRMEHISRESRTVYYNILLKGCKMLKESALEMGWSILDKMSQDQILPDSISFVTMLEVCNEVKDIDSARMMVRSMMNSKKKISIEAINTGLSVFCKMKTAIEESFQLLKWAKENGIEPDTISYNILLDHAFRLRDWERGEKIFKELQTQGLKPDATTYNYLIRAYSNSNQYAKVVATFKEMNKRNFIPNEQSCSSLVRVFHIQGNDAAALQVLNLMERHYSPRNDPSILAFVRAYISMGRLQDALGMKRMLSRKTGRLWKTIVTILMDAFASIGDLRVVEDLLDEMRGFQNDNILDPIHTGIYIKALCNACEHEKAFQVLKKDSRHDIIWYNTLLHSLAKLGEMDKLSQVLYYMQEQGIAHDEHTHYAIRPVMQKFATLLSEHHRTNSANPP
ncbi:mitochondrial protein translocase, MPT family [Galdieria sulphuraria]|uniref:Mitochondrial protein translocase, MPT family n=1 Tax=Galdieria sulphuraria TaxID=130081 RepID=M2X200_GALSU|nr:mitochondrial protein translocase, MPT family [Galdieria sulphuraria]EME30365.1 mitochondrial protein translocase, MPT family [Galdieria sulphuraria]|eukprot:XP_005706885.1 mitochondrial protein translocase, MPT family [Galdieria sulphuraria]